MTIKHTAYHTEGQIYIPEVNNLLAIGCHCAGADVPRVGEIGRGLRDRRHRDHGDHLDPLLHRGAPLVGLEQMESGGSLALFLSFDIPFLVANLFKFFEGGYVPMLDRRCALIAGMLIWSRGRTALMEQYTIAVLEPREGQALDPIAGSARGCPAVPSSSRPAPTTFRRSSCTTSSAAARCMRRSSC